MKNSLNLNAQIWDKTVVIKSQILRHLYLFTTFQLHIIKE